MKCECYVIVVFLAIQVVTALGEVTLTSLRDAFRSSVGDSQCRHRVTLMLCGVGHKEAAAAAARSAGAPPRVHSR